MTIIKPFARQGNFTQVDNAVFDEIMPTLNGSEWMVLSFIIRKTVGWQKDSDGISYSQFIKGTGISSNSTIKKALDSLVKKRLVLVGKTGNRSDCHYYKLNTDYSCGTTETVERPITFSVERPITETVDTKEILKKTIKKEGGDSDYAEVIASYENNIGLISPSEAQQIAAALDEFPKQYLLDAIDIAALQNAKKWSYINGILKRWRVNGKQPILQANGFNGAKRNEDGSYNV